MITLIIFSILQYLEQFELKNFVFILENLNSWEFFESEEKNILYLGFYICKFIENIDHFDYLPKSLVHWKFNKNLQDYKNFFGNLKIFSKNTPFNVFICFYSHKQRLLIFPDICMYIYIIIYIGIKVLNIIGWYWLIIF